MPGQPLDLIGGFYQDDSLPWACQDTVNWIPEAAEAQGTRTPSILRDAPGLRPYVEVGTGPIRGMRNVEGKLLVVSGTQLYQISNDLVAIPRGTIPGTGRVSMAHNSRSGGNQVTIVNGAAGYVYDTNALTLTRITDAGYPGAFVVDFVDGYMAQIEPLRRYWFHSELTQALDYNTLDRYPAEGQPDALVTLLVDHREVWVFGERTIEPFVNTGAATNTFARASNTVIENGCGAKFSPAKLDNSIFWLDELGIVRRAQGYTATRVSTSAIESAIASLDWSRAFGFTVTDRGHAIYYLTFPDGYTFGYDITTGLWHRRASYGLDRWRVAALAYWNGAYVCGDFQQGLLYTLDWEYPYDGDLPHIRERVTGVTHNNQSRVMVPYAELVVENGRAVVASDTAPAQPTGPSITGDAPTGLMGVAYSFSYTPTGGAAPLVVSLWTGTLPPGLTLSSVGVLSGTPTTAGSYSWVVRVTDANGLYDDLADTATVADPVPVLITNVKHYDGPRSALTVAAATVGWTSGVSLVEAAPNGLYAAGSSTGLGAPFFDLAKYDTTADTWSILADPASNPTAGPVAMAWSPDSVYLAANRYRNLGGTNLDDFIVYKRSGDTLTAITNPAGFGLSLGNAVAWNEDGTKIAIASGNTGNNLGVYDFAADVFSGLRTANNTGHGEQANFMAFRPGGGYIAVATATWIDIYRTTVSPMTVACSVAADATRGIHWAANGDSIIAVGVTGPSYVNVYSFVDTPATETLTFAAAAASQPASAPLRSGSTRDGLYMALSRSGSPQPTVYSIGTATPSVPTKLTDPATAGANIDGISWSEFNA